MSEEENKIKESDESVILKEIVFFISRFFIAELDTPTEEDVKHSELLAKLTIRLMAQMLERGMRLKRDPVFNVMFYVKDLGSGVGELNYSFETIGGQLFEELKLGVMGEELEKAIGEWCKKVWGGELHTKAAEVLQSWGGVINED